MARPWRLHEFGKCLRRCGLDRSVLGQRNSGLASAPGCRWNTHILWLEEELTASELSSNRKRLLRSACADISLPAEQGCSVWLIMGQQKWQLPIQGYD